MLAGTPSRPFAPCHRGRMRPCVLPIALPHLCPCSASGVCAGKTRIVSGDRVGDLAALSGSKPRCIARCILGAVAVPLDFCCSGPMCWDDRSASRRMPAWRCRDAASLGGIPFSHDKELRPYARTIIACASHRRPGRLSTGTTCFASGGVEPPDSQRQRARRRRQ